MLEEKNKRTLAMVLLGVFCLELIRTAWISDDAAITLRTVLNFIHGYGPTFNVDERVQAYTHPLWFFLISALSLIVRNVFTATFLLSISISLIAFWILLTRVSTNIVGAAIAGTALLLSKAYLDFSTSGLENPLSHLLILSSVLLALRVLDGAGFRTLALFFVSCSLIYLNRPDLLALIFPLAALVAAKSAGSPAKLAKAVLIGLVPLLGWTLFSTYYYGFPFPNTAYAKLGTGIPLGERFVQGLRYVARSVGDDPLTIGFIVAGVIIGLSGSAVSISLSLGIAVYLLYVLSIGGDFMAGRFFTAPLLVAAILVARSTLRRGQLALVGAATAVLGATTIEATLLSNATYSNTTIAATGIADERGFYYQNFGLLAAKKGTFAKPQWVIGRRQTGVRCGGLGYASIYDGPGMHYIDECALADPLLARLPAKYDPNWRIGHFIRQLPTDYEESIALNKNVLHDPQTHAYYDALRTITRGALNDPQRLRQIVRLNLGTLQTPDWDQYRNRSVARASHLTVVPLDKLQAPIEGVAWNAPGTTSFGPGVEVVLPRPMSFREIDMSVDNNDIYKVEIRSANGWAEVARIEPVGGAGMMRHKVALTAPTARTDRVRITPISGDGNYSLGHMILK